MNPVPLTVTELVSSLNGLLRKDFDDVRVAGEVSGLKLAASGHAYFTLKDAKSVVNCACWDRTMRYLRFRPREGLAVIARGSLEVYPQRGQLQLIVSGLEPQGEGALQAAFEALKKKLEAEGLFAAGRKRALPAFPRRIGIVTSPTGAVIRDMLHVLGRRMPGLEIRLFPALVQGPGATEALCAGLDHFSAGGWAHLVIIGRGGGSLQDLWAFNEEPLARAIARCAVPVISAVGHETDFTIADFVADLRAPTPSAAAEMAVPRLDDILAALEACEARSRRALQWRLSEAGRRLAGRGVERALNLLQRRLGRSIQVLDDADYRMRTRLSAMVYDAHRRLDPLTAQLEALSPLRVLERGYSIVQTTAGLVVRAPADAPPPTRLSVRTAGGTFIAESKECP